MYQALYRKWRPRSFDDVVGQEHITETLKRQLKTGRLSHAYLFVGTRGTGKTTCAKILARAANCASPENGNPCNKCPSCIGIESGAILDVEELDAASNNSVDNIRAIRDEAVFSPAAVSYRVYIIDEVHMLSTSAFNALLKILEEPPAHLIFILATTEVHKVPATILSRCQRFTFKRIPTDAIASRLTYVAKQENLPLTEEAAHLLASLADGSMRDALSLLDQCIWDGVIDPERVRSAVGITGVHETARMLDLISSGDTADALSLLNDIYFGGKEVSALLDELSRLQRDLLITKLSAKGDGLLSGRFDRKTIENLSGKFTEQQLISNISTIQDTLAQLSRSSDRKISAEMCLVRLCDPSLSPDISAISTRLSRVEDAMSSGNFQPSAETSKPSQAKKAADDVPWRSNTLSPEPKKTSTPDIKVAPKPVEDDTPHVSGTTDDLESAWQQILGMIEGKVDITAMIFIGDKLHAVPKLEGSKLTVQAKSAIAKNMINAPAVTTAIKQAADKVFGKPITVSISDFNAPSAGVDKLDSLKKFSNIKFE